jgi:hypothetical protein
MTAGALACFREEQDTVLKALSLRSSSLLLGSPTVDMDILNVGNDIGLD